MIIEGKDMKDNPDFQAFITLAEQMATEPQLFDEFCHLVFTPQEREQLGKRVRIINELLLQRLSQRDIAASLGLSISKITRGSNQLKQHDNVFLEKVKQALRAGPLHQAHTHAETV